MDNSASDKKDEINKRITRRAGSGRIWLPIGFVLVGTGLFLHQMNLGIPEWIFSWKIMLIAVGIFIGLSHSFRGPGWLIMILVGTFFLMDELIPGFDLHRFIWPAILVAVGIIMLIRPKKPYWMDEFGQRCNNREQERWRRRYGRRNFPGTPGLPGEPTDFNTGSSSGTTGGMGFNSKSFSSEDYIDATTVFGAIHKNILSKNFKGGDITIFMGGAEINLSQADIQGTAAIDITQIMGGTKIIVPPNWEVRSQLTSVFGNIEDKRQNISSTNPEKVLIIDGSSVFGGIEIRNY
jgi:predicted membrane protein